jgi:hypothetical protein
MALGATTYKTPNIINKIGQDLSNREGCGVGIAGPNTVDLSTTTQNVPYGIIVTGTDSLTPGTYPSAIGDASLELVDQLGCVVQVLASSQFSIGVGDTILIDSADADGTFTNGTDQPFAEGDWVWGYALTEAGPSEQFLMRFQPFVIQYLAP